MERGPRPRTKLSPNLSWVDDNPKAGNLSFPMTASVVSQTLDIAHVDVSTMVQRQSKLTSTNDSEADIDLHDENDFVQETTKAQQEHGESLSCNSLFRDPAKYEPYLEGLMKSLHKRESLLGRYNHVAALTYASLGNAFRNLQQEPRAIAFYRTQYRIQAILYGKTNGPISGTLDELLRSRGISSTEIVAIQSDLVLSTRHELQGDWFRRLGQWERAMVEYQMAARVEEYSFGRDNPDLAFVWRKMACLAAMKKDLVELNSRLDTEDPASSVLDFELADRMGNQWMRSCRKQLSSGNCALIRRGDHYFGLLLYSHAVGEYYKASSAALTSIRPGAFLHDHKPRPKLSRSKSRNKHGHGQCEEAKDPIAHELEKLLKEENQPQRFHSSDDTLTISIHSLLDRKEESSELRDDHRRVKDILIPSGVDAGQPGTGDLAFRISPRQGEDEPPAAVKTDPKSGVHKMEPLSRRGRKPPAAPSVDTKELASDSSLASGSITESWHTNPDPKKNASFSRRKPRSTRSSSSLPSFRRSSVRTLKIDEEEQVVSKPKSDSYISKIANKTRKVAKRVKDMASLDASKRKGRSVDTANPPVSLLTDPETPKEKKKKKKTANNPAKKQELSYNQMLSPPMTPFYPSFKAPNDFEQAKSSFLDAFDILDDATSQPQADSIDNSTMWGNEPQQHFGQSPTIMGGLLNQFLTSQEQREAGGTTEPLVQTKASTMSSPQGKTSDETPLTDNRRRTSKKSTSKTATKTNLVELVADIQSMSALLQRKTVRLQHRLAVEWAAAPTATGSRRSLIHRSGSNSTMARDTKELYGEIQRLFHDCSEALEEAFEQLEHPHRSSSSSSLSSMGTVALEDYRKTFLLERAFLEELGRKCREMLGEQPAPLVESKKEK